MKVTIKSYKAVTKTFDVTFPVYLEESSDYGDGHYSQTFIQIDENRKMISIQEECDGTVTITIEKEVDVGYEMSDYLQNSYGGITEEEFNKHLDAALKLIGRQEI